MEGSLRLRRAGVWEYRVHLAHGKYRSATIHASSERDARRQAADLYPKLKRAPGSKMTVAELVADRAGVRTDLAPKTLEREAHIERIIVDDLGSIPVRDLTAADIDRWLAKIRRTPASDGRARSEATVHHYFRVLRGILRQAEQWDIIDRSPDRRARVPKPERYEAVLPSDDVVRQLILAAEQVSVNFAMAVWLGAATGCREGEAAALRWGDVGESTLWVRRSMTVLRNPRRMIEGPTKGKRARELAIDLETMRRLAVLLSWVRTLPSATGVRLAKNPFILADYDADPTGATSMGPDRIAGQWSRLAKPEGIEMRFHDLRHWHGTRLMKLFSPADVANRLGHAQISTTVDRYGHAQQSLGPAVARAVGELMAGPEAPGPGTSS